MMIHVSQNMPCDATVTLYDASGAPTDADGDVEVTVTRENGTVLVAGTATSAGATGGYEFPLTATHTAQLDVLTLTWEAAIDSAAQTVTTVVEVRGALLFSIADARRVKPLDNTTTYPAARIAEARTLAETALEEACHVAFAPTYFRLRLDGNGRTDLLLPIVRPLTVTAATVDGASLTAADLELYDDGRVYYEGGWSAGRRNVVITGTHGYPFPPPRVGRAALLLAKRVLVDSPVSDRATSMTTEDGTTQFLVTAGVRQAVFDVPECNAVVIDYGLRDAFAVA